MSKASRPFFVVTDGIFYFSRRTPKEPKSHYTSPRIAFFPCIKSTDSQKPEAGKPPIRSTSTGSCAVPGREAARQAHAA